MESSGQTKTFTHIFSASSRPPYPPSAVPSPCAACKILRRRCASNCVLAPYFPPSDPLKFTTAHRVFGASNIIKFLQGLPENQREDAVSSMVYEADARIRDPVYGCTGAICQLQMKVSELQTQLAKAQAEIVNLKAQNANLSLIYVESTATHNPKHFLSDPSDVGIIAAGNNMSIDDGYFLDDNTTTIWEPLWQ